MARLGACVIVPTYNNERTLKRVIDGVLEHSKDVLVINDGSTDSTEIILKKYQGKINFAGYSPNKGKGIALRMAFLKAAELGFKYAITIDSDGQHFPEDIPKFLDEIEMFPGSMILGARNIEAEGMPGKNSFANKFSNFWYWAETGLRMPDTQTGFRLYPLDEVKKLTFFGSRFEFEVEVIVKLAWQGVEVRSIPVQVKYDPDERVSHFRPGPDFTRISFLNAYLVTRAIIWHHPVRFLRKNPFKIIYNEAVKKDESIIRKASSIGLGFFFGIAPIWGFQLAIGIPTAVLLRLNKVLFIAAANISIPPVIPFIIIGSFLAGAPFVGASYDLPNLDEVSIGNMGEHALQYGIGAFVLAIITGLTSFLVSLGLMSLFMSKRENPT